MNASATQPAPPDDLPLTPGQQGDAVRDLQQRLVRSGESPLSDPPGAFGAATVEAVRSFQARRGLHVDGVCGPQTWAALVEAGYQLGDRLLYHRTPMLRGDDVAALQVKLGALGFDAGRVDGIFGPQTAEALNDYQTNAGLTADGICGPDVLDTLERLGDRTGNISKAGVRERVELLRRPRHLHGRRILVAEGGALPALANALVRALDEAGAETLVVHHPDGSTQAAEANRFEAEAFIGLTLSDERTSRICFYSTSGFESAGGRQLATLAADNLARVGAPERPEVQGMRLPVLRETRMAAVACEVGPPSWVVENTAELSAALAASVARWAAQPVRDPGT